METSVKAADASVRSQPDAAAAADAPSAGGEAASEAFDPMVELSRRLEDIVGSYGSPAGTQSSAESEEMKKEAKEAAAVAVETVMKSLNKLSSPQEKLEALVGKYGELAATRRGDEEKLSVLQAETRSSVTARNKLENLFRELQQHYNLLREETLLRCQEDEEKRSEMADHFQSKLTEIQTQIEQHSSRNDNLCRENSSLTDKLESLMNQCELREEGLEKINKRRDLQQKLTEAKLQQADALLSEAEAKHKREKEYLLREAIDKTKKCFAMKEQELAMKKKLTLYAQKFDEFQETLAKSNEIYVRFKKEMDNMSEKLKKMETESNLWKTRFENCNKALTDMIEERTEKGKEYELFVLKIQKLEHLCRTLQEERVVLYGKIKEVRQASSDLPEKVFGSSNPDNVPKAEAADTPALLNPVEIQEIQMEDPILTEDMVRLREEQTKLHEIASSLLAAHKDEKEEDHREEDPEEDLVSSALIHFKTKTQVKKEVVEEKPAVAETVEEVPKPAMSAPEAPTPVEIKEVVKPVEEIQQQPAEPEPTSEPEEVKINPPTDLKPEAAEVEVLVEAVEVKPEVPVGAEKIQTGLAQVQEEAPTNSASAPPSEDSPKEAASSTSDSSKKQTPKKKKKRNGKNAS